MGLDYDLFIMNLFAKADEKSIPLSGAFELTSRCPFDCKMCYVHRKENDCEAIKQEKNTEWWINLAEEAKSAGMLMVLLTGGEPLLRKDFETIYLHAKKTGLMVSVNSNGLLIDDEKVKFFSKYPPQRLNITLYGASEETYRNLCGNGKAYQKVTEAVVKLKQAGVNVRLNFTATQYNANDTEKIFEFAKNLGLSIQSVTYMFPPSRIGGEAERMTSEEAAKVHFRCRMADLGPEKLKQHLEARENRETDPLPCEGGEKIPCRAGKSTFWVTWDGKMTPCGMMTKPMVEIINFNDAWESIKNSRENIHLPVKCKTCEFRKHCDVCAAIPLAETGEFSGVPEYVCKKAAYYKKLCDEFMSG